MPSQIGRRFEILIVDDNEDDLLLAQEAFRETQVDAKISVARNGVEALDMLKTANKKPDLILLDLNMPRKDGRETLAEIKNDQELKRIPVIVLTTSSSDNDIEKAYDLHANSYIIKPMNFDDFLIVINNFKAFWLKTARLPNMM